MNLTADDKMFLKDMIKHHQVALEMSAEIPKTSDLYEFAQGIIEAQSKEITLMKSWLKKGSSMKDKLLELRHKMRSI